MSERAPMTEAELLELIGDPDEFDRRREELSRSARRFSTNHDRFREEHPDMWVAVHGENVAAADTPEALFAEMERLNMPRRETCVRFVTSEKRTLIL